MSEATRKLLREAAPEPSNTPDFRQLWQRGRRRRLGQAATAAAGIAVVMLTAVVAGKVLPGRDGGVSIGWNPTPTPVVRVGPPTSVSPEWVEGAPVWIKVDDSGDVTIFDAVNPHPMYGLDELVGWCESSGWFQAWWDGSRFDGHGRYAFGPAPHDLPRYEIAATTLTDRRVRVGERVVPPGRSATDDEPDGPHCHGDGSGAPSTAEFHPVAGSGRELFDGAVVPGPDGVARFCAQPEMTRSCPAGSPTVPQAESLPENGIRGLFLAREDDSVLRDVIYLPEGYDP